MGLVRLAWHAAGTYDKATNSGGSDGATMRFAPESDHGANAGLAVARTLLEPIQARHPGISTSDLWQFAAVVAIEEMGGPKIPFRPGRVDKPDETHCTPDGRLPDAAQTQNHIRDIFYRMCFNDREIVALLGAHAIGRCHSDRSGFDGPWTKAPTMFSNEFYRELLEQQWTPRRWNGPKSTPPTKICFSKISPKHFKNCKKTVFKLLLNLGINSGRFNIPIIDHQARNHFEIK